MSESESKQKKCIYYNPIVNYVPDKIKVEFSMKYNWRLMTDSKYRK